MRIERTNDLERDLVDVPGVAIIVILNFSDSPASAFESYTPLITPVFGSIESPAGRPVAE